VPQGSLHYCRDTPEGEKENKEKSVKKEGTKPKLHTFYLAYSSKLRGREGRGGKSKGGERSPRISSSSFRAHLSRREGREERGGRKATGKRGKKNVKRLIFRWGGWGREG